MMLGRQKYIQQKHYCLIQVPLRSRGPPKAKKHKPPGDDQIPAELIKAGGRAICSEIYKLMHSTWNKEKLTGDWKELITIPLPEEG